MALLEVNNVHTYYGNIHALKGVTLNVDQGEIVTLIGGNGAGKTTTLRTISGLLKPRAGNIILEGEDLERYKAHQIVYKGVAMVPEGRGVFARLSVSENLDLGAYSVADRSRYNNDLERVFGIFPRLKERRTQVAGTLSGGEQQMLAIGRAMMANRARSCWTSLPWGWRPCWSRASSKRSNPSTRKAPPSCWSNKMR